VEATEMEMASQESS